MPVFEYAAYDSQGENKTGTIEADSIEAAQRLLKKQGLYPTDIIEPFQQKKTHTFAKTFFSKSISPRVLAAFTRELALLLQASVPLLSAIESISRASSSKQLTHILATTRDMLKNGETFAATLATFPTVFSPVYVSMVQAGEHSGTLETVLEEMADLLEKQADLQGNILSALAYPFFLLLIGSVLITVLFTVMVPEISRVFLEAGHALPAPTRALIFASKLARAFWWLPPLLVTALASGWKMGKKVVSMAKFIDRAVLHIPLVGGIIVRTGCARFCRVLAVLLEATVPLLQALPMAGRASGNKTFIHMSDQAAQEIRHGKKLGQALASFSFLPGTVLELITIGEQSGSLGKMLLKAASFLEKETTRRLKTMVSLLEPIMICVMGLVIGFVVVSLFLPLMEMNRFIG